MAKVVGVINTAHSPFCYLPVEKWNGVRERRPDYRADVPVESPEEQTAKAARVKGGFRQLKEVLTGLQPDVLVVFGDDQAEYFHFDNFPNLALFVGPTFRGHTSSEDIAMYTGRKDVGDFQEVKNHEALSKSILTGMLKKGFDPAFMLDSPAPDASMCHAVMRPLESLTDYSIPTVPVLINAYYCPQITAARSYAVGRAVFELVEAYEEDLRVVFIGSGGLWHTPGQPGAFLDEHFDRRSLELLARGSVEEWAGFLDTYPVADDDPSQDPYRPSRHTTGLPTPGGPQGGTRESCNWIAASAGAEGRAFTVVDYIPIYTSPIGAAFAYCTDL